MISKIGIAGECGTALPFLSPPARELPMPLIETDFERALRPVDNRVQGFHQFGPIPRNDDETTLHYAVPQRGRRKVVNAPATPLSQMTWPEKSRNGSSRQTSVLYASFEGRTSINDDADRPAGWSPAVEGRYPALGRARPCGRRPAGRWRRRRPRMAQRETQATTTHSLAAPHTP